MRIEFDPDKDSANVDKHGLSLAMASQLEWGSALVWSDQRTDYGEARHSALGLIEDRVYFVAFADRGNARAGVRRIISLRKANNREKLHYANTFDAS